MPELWDWLKKCKSWGLVSVVNKHASLKNLEICQCSTWSSFWETASFREGTAIRAIEEEFSVNCAANGGITANRVPLVVWGCVILPRYFPNYANETAKTDLMAVTRFRGPCSVVVDKQKGTVLKCSFSHQNVQVNGWSHSCVIDTGFQLPPTVDHLFHSYTVVLKTVLFYYLCYSGLQTASVQVPVVCLNRYSPATGSHLILGPTRLILGPTHLILKIFHIVMPLDWVRMR